MILTHGLMNLLNGNTSGNGVLHVALLDDEPVDDVFFDHDIEALPSCRETVLNEEQKKTATESDEGTYAGSLSTFHAAFRLGPLTLLMAMASGMSSPLSTEFLKLRVCEVALNISANVCMEVNLAVHKIQADMVVQETSHYTLYSSLIGSLPPVIFSIFIGAWTDIHGRKVAMLCPLIGSMLSAAYMSVVTNFLMSPNYLLIPPVITSLSGGWTVLLMAKYSYLGDCTTNQNRAMNIAIIDGISILFSNIGGLFGGYLYTISGIQVVFYVVTAMHTVSLLYVVLVIHDRPSEHADLDSCRETGCGHLFSLDRLRENMFTLGRKRAGQTRKHIYILLGSLLLYTVCILGDSSVTQLFLEFQPFTWSVQFYTLFNCISGLCSSIVLICFMIVFRKYAHLADTSIGFIAALSSVLYFFGYGIAQTNWMIFLFTALGILKHMVTACIRSLLCSFVERHEMGKIMSVISSLQALTPLFGSAIFTTLFAETSSWYPGLCFLVAAFLSVPVMAAFGYVDVARRHIVYYS